MNPEEKAAAEDADKKIKEAIDTRNSDRIKLMEQIADNSETGRNELDEADETEARAAREAEEERAYAKKLQEEGLESKEEVQDESDTRVTNGETYYRQVVNGVEKWQTLKQIRETAQKVDAADEYLRTASESVRNASRLALTQKDEPSRPDKDGLKKLLASAVLGDEEAIEQLASAISSRPSEVTSDVLEAVDHRLSFRTELAALEAEQSDVLGDPYLGKLFKLRLNEMKQENPNTPLATAYKSIGKEIRDRFGASLKGSKTQEKLERKRTLVNPPTASQRQATEVEEDGEESAETIIERMAKARGLNAHVHTRRQ